MRSEHLSLAMADSISSTSIQQIRQTICSWLPRKFSIAFAHSNDDQATASELAQLSGASRACRVGDDFARRGKATVLIVRAALAPTESNWLINPLHSGFGRSRMNPPEPFEYDIRFQQA